MRLLVVDSGNSRIKWGLREGDAWTEKGAAHRSELDALESVWKRLSPDSAIGSNVATGETAQRLGAFLPGIRFSWIESKTFQCGVENGYEFPDRLGTDRWAALIGARSRLPEGGIVAGLGTAMTVDLLSPEGRFEGGIIVPGLQTMRQSLKNSTCIDPGKGKFSFPPTNTFDAVESGAILALAGAIEKISRSRGNPRCLLFGGDAGLVIPHLEAEAEVAEDLVLEGLALISGEAR